MIFDAKKFMNKQLSIIICTYNRDKYIAESIRASFNQTTDPEHYEVIVINNNSTDRTHEICTNLLNAPDALPFRYFIETSQGLSHARNRGILEAKGEILCFIDDDAMMEENYTENLIRFFAKHPEVSAVGGRIYPRFEGKAPNWLSHFLVPLMSTIDLGNEAKPFKFGKYPIGANMAIKASVFERIAPFDVHLGRTGSNLLGGEEKDIFSRMRAQNHSIWYVPDAVVHHVIPDSRLQKSFIKKVGIGIGLSERIRSKTVGGTEFFKSAVKELSKWAATCLLSLGYTCMFSPAKGIMLIRFRFWVSKGFFNY